MLSTIGLFLVFNPIFGFILPVIIFIIFFPKKIIDILTFRKYLLTFIALTIVVTFGLESYERLNPSNPIEVSDSTKMIFREAIIIAYLIRLILCFAITLFVGQRLRALSKSRFYLLLLGIPILSPFFLIYTYFMKEKIETKNWYNIKCNF